MIPLTTMNLLVSDGRGVSLFARGKVARGRGASQGRTPRLSGSSGFWEVTAMLGLGCAFP